MSPNFRQGNHEDCVFEVKKEWTFCPHFKIQHLWWYRGVFVPMALMSPVHLWQHHERAAIQTYSDFSGMSALIPGCHVTFCMYYRADSEWKSALNTERLHNIATTKTLLYNFFVYSVWTMFFFPFFSARKSVFHYQKRCNTAAWSLRWPLKSVVRVQRRFYMHDEQCFVNNGNLTVTFSFCRCYTANDLVFCSEVM